MVLLHRQTRSLRSTCLPLLAPWHSAIWWAPLQRLAVEHVELHGIGGATTRLSSDSFVPIPYLPGAVRRDAGASAQSWLAVGSVSRALQEPVALVGEGDWVERPGGKADVRDFVCLLSGRRCYS